VEVVRVGLRNGQYLLHTLNVWLRHCATNGKAEGSIPDGVIGIFHWNNPGPGVDSASNRNECHGYFLGGKGGRCVGLATLRPSCVDCLEIWEPQLPGTHRAPPVSTGMTLPFIRE
jgi:hypothetical protein